MFKVFPCAVTRMSRRDPFEDIEQLFERLGAGFEDVSRQVESEFGAGDVAVDVADDADEVVVHADLPGYETDDIHVTVQDRSLRISAERSSESEDAKFLRRERTRRAVSRTVGLPTEVDPEGAAATHENGVLEVRLPKLSPAAGEGHSIDID